MEIIGNAVIGHTPVLSVLQGSCTDPLAIAVSTLVPFPENVSYDYYMHEKWTGERACPTRLRAEQALFLLERPI